MQSDLSIELNKSPSASGSKIRDPSSEGRLGRILSYLRLILILIQTSVIFCAGIVQRRLSNGIKVNYWHSDNEPRSALMRIVGPGGRAVEGVGPGPSGCGAVAVGTRTLSESGTVGKWSRDQTELFVISKLLNCVLEADEEFAYMDCQFAVGERRFSSKPLTSFAGYAFLDS